MFITKKHLSRRTFLRGAGVAVGLPLLDAMIPAWTALAQTAAKPTPHMGFIYFPHGAVMDQWTPAAEGTDFELFADSEAAGAVPEAINDRQRTRKHHGRRASVHALSPGTWLSCVRRAKSQEPYGGITIDQIAAQHIGQDTPLPSLEVATEVHGGGGSCDRDYGCSYCRHDLVPHADDAAADGNRSAQAVRTAVRSGRHRLPSGKRSSKQYGSILDMVSEEAAEPPAKPRPRQDRAMLGDYLDTVREIERRVQKMESSATCQPEPARRAGWAFRRHSIEQLNLMFDMVALAYQANLTRVFTLHDGQPKSADQTYNHIGVPDAFHPSLTIRTMPKKLGPLGQDPDVPHRGLRQVPAKLAACRTATAPCWITR